MDKFILLHDADTNKPALMKASQITGISSYGKKSKVYLNTDEYEWFSVNESPENIFNKLGDDDFIKLHKKEDNTPVIINKEFILLVYINGNDTEVELSNTDNYTVNETVEYIMKVLNS